MPSFTSPDSVKETDCIVTGISTDLGPDESLLPSFQGLSSPTSVPFMTAKSRGEMEPPGAFRLGHFVWKMAISFSFSLSCLIF